MRDPEELLASLEDEFGTDDAIAARVCHSLGRVMLLEIHTDEVDAADRVLYADTLMRYGIAHGA